MFQWPHALLEGAILAFVLGALFASARLRTTLRSAPRALQLGAVLALTVWTASQVAEVPLTTYPLMSWHMYGESRDRAPVVGYRMLGEACDGSTRILPNSGHGLGRRPLLASGLRRAYNDARTLPHERARALARVDSLLALVTATWNANARNVPLCGVALQQVILPADNLAAAPLPPYVTVRRHVAAR
ncbi:hypothetical protein [Gemmatimonas sp.]